MWLEKIDKKVVLIFLLSLFLRFYKLENYPVSLYWDEVSIGYNAFSVLQTGKDEYSARFPMLFKSFSDYKLPGYIYLDSIFIKYFGLSTFSLRAPSALLGSLAPVVFYFLLKNLLIYEKSFQDESGKTIALAAAFLLAISPWHLQFSRAAFEANVALSILLLGTSLLIVGLKNKSAAFFSIPTLAISIYFYYSERLLVPAILIIFLVLFKNQLRKNLKAYLVSLLAAVIIALPISFYFTRSEGIKRVSEVSIFADTSLISENVFANSQNPNLLKTIFLNWKVPIASEFLHNYFSHFSFGFLFFGDDPNPRHSAANHGNLYLVELPLILIGISRLLYFKNKKVKYFLIGLLLISPLPASLAKDSPHALRALQMLVPILTLSALGLQKVLSSKNLRLWMLAIFLISGANYLVNYYYLYPLKNNNVWAYGYKELYRELSTLENKYDTIIVSGDLWKPYLFYLYYRQIDPSCYQNFGSQQKIGKYNFGPTPWDQNGLNLSEDLIESKKSGKTLVAISQQELEQIKSKEKFEKISDIKDFSGRRVIFEIGEWYEK